MKVQAVRLIIFSIAFIFSAATYACTDFRLTAKDGTVLITRSMEFPIDMKSNLRTSVRDRQITTPNINGQAGLNWKAKYGYLYVDAFGQDIVVDGMNETGLSFEYLYLPGETQYPTVPAGKESQALPYYQFGEWVLSNFKTIDEVKNALSSISIYQAYLPIAGMPNMIYPLHASIYDASGKGIVVEFVNGNVNVYDSIGILTNSPTYDWQVTNLRNYLNLSPYVPKTVTFSGISYSATGQGSGSVGLPGDVSPPSRFTKIAFLTTASFPAINKTTVVNVAQHIINNVDIPTGIARSIDNGKESSDYTQWVVFKDLTNKVMYYRTYDDLTLRSIEMGKLDFSEKAQPMKTPMAQPAYAIDMTAKLIQLKPMNAKPVNVKPVNVAPQIQAHAASHIQPRKLNATASKK